MTQEQAPKWTFLTNHAQALLCIAHDPGVRLREIGEQIGITERAAHRIVGELDAAGYVVRQRVGRRNQYTIQADLPMPDRVAREQKIGVLLTILTTPEGADSQPDPADEAPTKKRKSPPSSRARKS
jgi:hypothetical protein